MVGSTAKRFYKSVLVESTGNGFFITLDGRSVKTPAGKALTLPYRDAAEIVAAEWGAQAEIIRPHTMPMTQLANTALDRVSTHRDEVCRHILTFGETDTLCYWADGPLALINRQRAVWQPLLDWATDKLGVRLKVTAGIRPVQQERDALSCLDHELSSMMDIELAVMAAFASCTGSLIVPFAVRLKRLDAVEAFEVALLEELFQAEKWGGDAEAAERRQRLREDMAIYARLLTLCQNEFVD
jgi:chaperone required for assembly of F1-ATPase